MHLSAVVCSLSAVVCSLSAVVCSPSRVVALAYSCLSPSTENWGTVNRTDGR